MFKKSWFSIADTFDQPLDVGSTPTFAGATLSGLTASTVIYSNASKAITSLANGAGYLYNDGAGALSWAAVSLSGYLKADGTVPLTAAWDAGEYGITALNLTADPTLGNEINTGFASWTAAAGWTYGGGKWTHSSGTTALTDDQSAVFDTSKTYKVVVGYTWAGSGSSIIVAAGGIAQPAITSAAANSVTYYIRPTATTRLTITPTTGFTGSIDSVSIKEDTNGTISNGAISLSQYQLLLPRGNASNLSLAFTNDPDTGLYSQYNNYMEFRAGGDVALAVTASACGTGGWFYIGTRAGTPDCYLIRDSAYTLQLGIDAASPIAYTIKAGDTSADNTAGASLSLKGGQSKGSAGGGSVKIATAPAGSAGSTTNSYVDRVEVDSTGAINHLGTNGSKTVEAFATTTVTTTAAATATATNLIPAGSMVIGVSTRVVTALTGDAGFTGYSVGDGSDVDRWGANLNPADAEVSDLTDCTVTSPPIYAAATSVVLTQVGGSTFVAGGSVRIVVHYMTIGAATAD